MSPHARQSAESLPPVTSYWSGPIPPLLLLLGALLVVSQYTLMEKFRVFPAAQAFGNLQNFLDQARNRIDLGMEDALLVAAILGVGAAILILELWSRELSGFLQLVFQNENATLGLLISSCLIATRFYFAPGPLAWAGDSPTHIAYAHIAARAFSLGEIPIWTNYFGTGSPYLQFYGPLFYYLVGLVHLVCRDLYPAIKIVLAAGHVLSGVGLYLLVRCACRSRQAGFLAGLAYVLSFWHTQQVLVMGRLPLSWFYALLPLPFYFFEQLLLTRRQWRAVWGGGLTLGLLAFTHPGYAFWATLLLGIYMALRIGTSPANRRSISLHSLLLLGTGIAFGAYATLPMLLERSHTGLHAGFSLSSLPDPVWQQVLYWSNYYFCLLPLPPGEYSWHGGYLGLSLACLSLVGLVAVALLRCRLRVGPTLAGAACLLLCLLLVFGYRHPPLRSLEVVQAFNAGRYLLFVVFFLAIVTGIAAKTLGRLFPKSGKSGRLFLVLTLVVLVDLLPTTFRYPYIKPAADLFVFRTPRFAQLREKVGPLAEDRLPASRIFYTTGKTHSTIAVGRTHVETGIPTFQALYDEAPRTVGAFCRPIERYLSMAFEGLEPSAPPSSLRAAELLLSALHLLNVRYVVVGSFSGDRLLEMPEPSPVVVSSRISGHSLEATQQLAAEVDLDPSLPQGIADLVHSVLPTFHLIGKMELDRSRNVSQRILVEGIEGEQGLNGSPSVELLEHSVWNQRVEIRLRTTSACYARLAYAFYPYLEVRVDGQQVAAMKTAAGAIALPLSPGEHRIVLEPRLSPIRRLLLGVTLTLLAAPVCASLSIRSRRDRAALR